MWGDLRREFQQRRHYLLVISLGCGIMVIGVITSLSSLRISSSSNRFLGPILTFLGFTAILFGVRWRKSILMAEHQQAGFALQDLQSGYPVNPITLDNEFSHNNTFHRERDEQDKFLVAPAYSGPGNYVHPPYLTEPPPPYEPPSYQDVVRDSAAATSSECQLPPS